MIQSQAIYRETYRSGGFDILLDTLFNRLRACDLCPRKCGVNRLDGETGICKTGRNALVSSYSSHYGEESCLVGTHGSGTIFFTHCNLLCNFCQNYEISHKGEGYEVNETDLADIMLSLQLRGCHNINLVSPSHVIPQIMAAVKIACENGLHIPLVYNSGGYDDISALKLIEGIIDIYMPDLKFANPRISDKCCNAANYFEIAKVAIKEMFRQKGVLKLDHKGIAYKGLLVRHLVMPSDLANTNEIMEFLASEISANTYINIMDQYHPCGKISPDAEISRPISSEEYKQAVSTATSKGLHNFL